MNLLGKGLGRAKAESAEKKAEENGAFDEGRMKREKMDVRIGMSGLAVD